MSFHNGVSDMLTRYANDVCVKTGENEVFTKAFIQPLRHKSGYGDKIQMSGRVSDSFLLYIGSPDCELCAKTPSVVSLNDEKYVVHNTQSYYYKNKKLYVWAVLKPYYQKRRDDYECDQ